MAADGQISFEVTLDEKSIRDAYAKLDKASTQSGKTAGDNFGGGFKSGINGVFGGLKRELLALGASLVAGFTLKKAVEESLQAEQAIKQFSISLQNAGKYSKEAVKSFTDYAQSLEAVTAVDADLITQNAALLVSLGNLSGQGLKDATKGALDLAAGLGKSTEEAFQLVTKAASGSASALSRYGFKVDETLPKSEQFAAVLGQIEKRFGGLAEANTQGFSGSLKVLSTNFDNLLESFGNLITSSPVVTQLVKDIADGFKSFSKTLDSLKGSDPVGALIFGLISIGRVITGYVLPVVETLTRTFITGLLTLELGVNALAVLVSGLAAGLIKLFVDPLKVIATGYAELIGLVDGELGNKLKNSINNLATGLTQPINDEFEKTKKRTAETFDQLAQASNDTFSNKISKSADEFLKNYQEKVLALAGENKKLADDTEKNGERMKATFYGVSEAFTSFYSGFKAQAADLAASAQKNFSDAGRAAFTQFGQGVGQAFANVGKALQKGENALEAFGNAILQTIGQVCVQLGTTFILQGLAALYAPIVGAALGITNPAGLIAAGAALAAFGGLLAASAGGSTNASAGGGGGGTETSPGGGGFNDGGTFTQPEDLQPQGPQTAINVTVQGNILDRRQSGLEIAEVLQEAFSSQGISIGATS